MKFDLNEISALLHIHEKAGGHPKLKPIADAAMKHLETMAEETSKPVESEPSKEVEQEDDGKENPAATIERKL